MRAFLFAVALLLPALAHAQAPEWVVYDRSNAGLPDNQVNALAVDGAGVAWFGTSAGLARFDGTRWTTYDTTAARLPDPYVTAVEPDGAGGVWVGTVGGLAHFDGTTWARYLPSNSLLPHANVTRIVRDGQGRVWVGTAAGLVRIDGSGWTVYDEETSELFEDHVRSIAVGADGVVWVGTFDDFQFQGWLWRFDGAGWTGYRLDRFGLSSSIPDALTVDAQGIPWMGVNGTMGGALVRAAASGWTVYQRANSGLPPGGVHALAYDDGVHWIGTGAGLAAFDGTAWRVFDPTSTGLPDAYVFALDVDAHGNKWVGTIGGGAAVYREGGVSTGGAAEPELPVRAELFQNYPNPFNPSTRIRFRLHAAGAVSLRVYDLLGREVAVLVDGHRAAGEHDVAFDAAPLPGGVYLYRLQAGGEAQHAAMTLLR